MARVDLTEPFALRMARKSVRESLSVSVAPANLADGLECDSVSVGENGEGFVTATNLRDVRLGKFGIGVSGAVSVPVSAGHVIDVLLLGAHTKVVRLNANGPVAGVEYIQPLRDHPKERFVCDPRSDEVASGEGDETIPGTSYQSGPVPAPVGRSGGFRGLPAHNPKKDLSRSLAVGPVDLERTAPLRVSEFSPSVVVPVTPPSLFGVVDTPFDLAGGVCHVDR